MAGKSFEPGTLWELLQSRTRQAARSGTIRPIPTRCELVEQGGVRFVVRVVENLARKDAAASPASGSPFLPPYEPDLFVADVSKTHVGLLNKFNVLPHHLLIVTREFESQLSPLALSDFVALWTCMAEFDGLAFYNAGEIAGASQSHKHLQLVPLPLAPEVEGIPIETLLDEPESGLPFAHAFARIDSATPLDVELTAQATLEVYRSMLDSLGVADGPYNLLVTRRWMLLVPRSRECYESVSINALGFAGALLVRDEQRLRLVRERGPLTLLEAVAVGSRRG